MAGHAGDRTSRGERSRIGQVSVGHHASGVAVVTMLGEHDLGTQPELARALQLAAAHSNVVVDLSECTFLDSSVIKEFVKTAEVVRASGEQILLVLPPEQAQLARIAELAGLAQIFELHESKDAAFARLEEARGKEAELVNRAERARRLEPSPPRAIDGTERAAPTHEIRVRDRRARFGDPEVYVAECTCGWTSEPSTGRLADRVARRNGLKHVESELPPYGHRGHGAI